MSSLHLICPSAGTPQVEEALIRDQILSKTGQSVLPKGSLKVCQAGTAISSRADTSYKGSAYDQTRVLYRNALQFAKNHRLKLGERLNDFYFKNKQVTCDVIWPEYRDFIEYNPSTGKPEHNLVLTPVVYLTDATIAQAQVKPIHLPKPNRHNVNQDVLDFEYGDNYQVRKSKNPKQLFEVDSFFMPEKGSYQYNTSAFIKNLQSNYQTTFKTTFAWIPIGGILVKQMHHAMPFDSKHPPKLASDAPLEYQIIEKQMQSLVNRSFLPGYQDANKQQAMLYSNALKVAKKYDLKLGMPIDPSRFTYAHTPLDMIWPEMHTVEGEQVLVPVVYLSKKTIDEQQNKGPLLEAGNITLSDFSEVNIVDAQVKALHKLYIEEIEHLINLRSSIKAEDILKIQAKGSVANYSGVIEGYGVEIVAQNLHSETLLTRKSYAMQGRHGEQDDVVQFATIRSLKGKNKQGGDLILSANSDIRSIGGRFQSDTNTRIESKQGSNI